MNDRQDPYGEQQFYGYDEYGRPIYHDLQATQQTYDPYAGQPVYDPYATQTGQQQPIRQDYGHDQYGYEPYAQQPQQAQQNWVPQQPQYEDYGPQQSQQPQQTQQTQQPSVPEPRQATQEPEDYRTEQFSFIEEKDEESEDVIDWLKFSESRTERREEAKRRGRNRIIALIVALTLALVGGVGYLWYAGKLPGMPSDDGPAVAADSAEKRDVIVVHLRQLGSGDTSTALLVNNETAGRATTVLLPNSLALSSDEGTTTLGKSFKSQGAGATRDALDTLLGSDIKGTWRLDTPYLENLVQLVSGITVDADTTVPGAKEGDKPLVHKGSAREMNGQTAVAYATYRAAGEPQTKQLARFGQVLQATLKKLPKDAEAATSTVQNLGQIPDPSLSDSQLGSALALLAEYAGKGAYETELLPVEANGTLSDKTAEGLVKKVLGGTVKNSDPDAALRVRVKNATGTRSAADTARAALANGGYTVVSTGAADAAVATSTVTYKDEADAKKAQEVAKTLGLSPRAARKGEGAANADVTVVLGKDYKG
ncbi:LCP family protein [Streptomyces gobiensis]|uniref:LCP family protein n=1 Tax=Streptomyces gobiensis TaxID=2875706 RepID=UPI001E28B89B|nr:LCP family protein [Streptomyces gobiensis]UGY91391.1 LCP family protein [Streptomyces gobiensis]